MQAEIKVGASCAIKVTGENPVDLIKGIAQFSQLPASCGHCDSKNLALQHRTAGQSSEYDYLTLQCSDCGAALDIGQTKSPKGGIFPILNPKDKKNAKKGFYHWKEQDYAQNSGGGGGQQQQQSQPQGGGTPDDSPF